MPPKKVVKSSKESTFRAKVRKQILKKQTPTEELDYEIEADYEPDGTVEQVKPQEIDLEPHLSAVEKKFLKALEEFKATQEQEYQKKAAETQALKEERRKKKKKDLDDLMNERLSMHKKEIEKEFNEKLKTHGKLIREIDSLTKRRHNTFNF